MWVVRLALCSLFALLVIFQPKPASADFVCCNQWIREPGSAGLCRNSTEGRTCCQKGLSSMKGPERALVCTSLNSCSEVRPYCSVDCDQLAQQLRDELKNATNYNAMHPGELADFVSGNGPEPSGQIAEIEREWATLKTTCPNIGSLGPGLPDGEPTPVKVIDPKTPGGQAEMTNVIAALNAHAAAAAGAMVPIQVACGTQPNVTVGTTVTVPPVGVGVQVQNPGPAKCAQDEGIQAIADEAAAYSHLAAAAVDLKADPPSNDFQNVVTPTEVKVVLPETASPIVKRAGEAILSLKRIGSYLDAYRVSYERYQGASAANKAGYMWVQAAAMEDFADRAEKENMAASSAWSDYRHETNKQLTLMLQQAAQAGVRWNDRFNDMRVQLRDHGLPPYIADTLRANGGSQADIDALQQAVLAVTEQQLESEIARMKADASTPAVSAGYDTLGSFLRMLKREAIRLQRVPDN